MKTILQNINKELSQLSKVLRNCKIENVECIKTQKYKNESNCDDCDCHDCEKYIANKVLQLREIIDHIIECINEKHAKQLVNS